MPSSLLSPSPSYPAPGRAYAPPTPTFTDNNAGLTGVQGSSVAWGDYDSNGKLDILLTGYTGSALASKIYRNEGDGSFSEDTTAESGLTRVFAGSVAWGDYNSDGKPDILLTGDTSSTQVTKIFKNNGDGTFSEDTTAEAGLIGIGLGSVAWGDYNSDGNPDILLTGGSSLGRVAKIYKNNGDGSFGEDTTAESGLTAVNMSSVAWGDYDSDGKLDILLTGDDSSHQVAKIYKNNGVGNAFTEDTTAPTAP